MTKSGIAADALVDEFVRYLNHAEFEPGFPDDVPEELRTSEASHGMFHWRIHPATFNPWIEDLANKLRKYCPPVINL